MPTCAAEDCTNSSKKKFKMNSFPRNSIQRDIWIKNIGRKNWVPNENTALCEIKMPYCCVPMCNNSSAKGYLLKCFPKNDKRRTQWVKNINRLNWSPNHSHRVCEDHFAPNMWEKTRVDGSRKLKHNAVPTIFGECVVKESPAKQVEVSSVENITEDNETKVSNETSLKNVTTNSQTIIKIIPSVTCTNAQTTPILIPAANIFKAQSISPTSAIIVNSQGKIVNSHSSAIISGATSILKPQVKMTSAQSSSPMIISTNATILKNQIKVANSQMPIIVPAGTTSINLTNATQVKPVNSQPILIPVATSIVRHERQTDTDSKIESDVADSESFLIKHPINTDSDESESKNPNQQTASMSKSAGIILNKTQAKKVEDERFEKMDKLLLKQLKLNNALRKKLNLMSHKIQQLMKEQNSDYKTFLQSVFTEDQIRVLELRHTNPKSITAWSHKTMLKAIKLKQECGTRGYEELLNQNMPLPSIRTICRWCTSKNIPIP